MTYSTILLGLFHPFHPKSYNYYYMATHKVFIKNKKHVYMSSCLKNMSSCQTRKI